MIAKIPARIHAILAREANTAVVFRRGPAKKTAVVGWNLKTDTFKVGQWFCGSFYPYRCDLSPDGRHLVYFAAKYRTGTVEELIDKRLAAELGDGWGMPMNKLWNWLDARKKRRAELWDNPEIQSEVQRQIRAGTYTDYAWTAVSRAPYLKALAIWFQGSGWNGGGLFVDNRRLALNRPPRENVVSCGAMPLREVSPPDYCTNWGCSGECPMVYVPRLVRDGWTILSEDRGGWQLVKTVFKGLTLRKQFLAVRASSPGYGCYWERHALVDANDSVLVDGKNWRWADYDQPRKRIVYAEDGNMFALYFKGGQLATKHLADLNSFKFERLVAPY